MTISLEQNFWTTATLQPTKLYVTCLTYSYPQNLKHPFDVTYLPNSCEASVDSFFLPSNDQLTSEVAFKDLSIWFLNFD